ncbi:DUF6046 domain-containing protein [Psychroflexus sp. ALD_RP9]|uniref:DUF6046 domain-containing protein n=1 Tax=Psychroflexus sp. ALD_RP9 TaxID=2777186 RepID=UPI001A8EFE88|nr:DUF6046 domain-containing protein [Psychroflexus sp. ALD_RP9]QSS96586.1 hypothetical protein IMZ30_09045 [Psychroflexus sp. ALD_RP9]
MSRETIVIDLAARYAAAFGMMAVNNSLNAAVVDANENDYGLSFYPTLNEDVEQITFKHNSQQITFGQMLTSVSPNVLAPPLVMEFSRKKQLIETQVNGSDNIIVERWGTRPWQIEMRGLLVDMENKTYPQSQVEAITQFFEINNIIDVEGTQFEDKRIDSIYFTSIRLEPLDGYEDTLVVILSAKSIKPVEFNVFS